VLLHALSPHTQKKPYYNNNLHMKCVPLRSINLYFKHFYAANINEYRAK